VKSISFGDVSFECSKEITGDEDFSCFGTKSATEVTITNPQGGKITVPVRYLIYFIGEIVKCKKLKDLDKQKEKLKKAKAVVLFDLV